MLHLSPSVAKVFGMPVSVSTNLAYDKYQGLMAYGTSTKVIKIISLKGYEFEIYEAHDVSIRFLAFVPNQGVLVSIDDSNEVRVWNLKDLTEDPLKAKIPLE